MLTDEEKLANLQYAFDSLPKGIQSPEARIAEVEFRLLNLQRLIDTGDWEDDTNGNVVPTAMSDEDKAVALVHGKCSIIERIPVVEGLGAGQLAWHAAGSIICGENVFYSGKDSFTSVSITGGSTVTNSTIRLG